MQGEVVRIHMPHRLLDICLAVVVKHLDKVASFEGLPDDLCQKLMVMIKSKDLLTPKILQLFMGCKLSKLDLKMKAGANGMAELQITDEWLQVTKGDMEACLESLDLSGGGVTDEGVGALHHLTNLIHLNLSRCQRITGSFLTKWRSPLLQSLILERCSALDVHSALAHLPHFPTLRSLNIAGCNFRDKDLEGLTALSLHHLDISNNPQLTPSSLKLISTLTQLKDLSISHCTQFVQEFHHIRALTSLTKLIAASCDLNDEALTHLESLPLETLVISSNKFTDAGMESLGKLRTLSALDLSLCMNLTDKGLLILRGLELLKQLNLNFCRNLTNSALVGFTQLTSLGIIGCDRLLIQAQQRQRPLVLLAEDNLMQTQLIKRVFERYHFDVATACNGQMALDMYKSNPNFVLILMDVMMPIMDGLTSTMLIRKYEWERGLKRTPIIMQTADVREAHRQLCLDAGCDDFVTKPLDKRVVDLARELIGS